MTYLISVFLLYTDFETVSSSTIFCSQFLESEWYERLSSNDSPLANAIMDRISYDSYKIDIESIDPKKDISMREVYGLDPALAK